MKKILLLSDTHSYIDERMLYYVSQADEVWHAGDIGNLDVINQIQKLKPIRAVYGNIDGQEIRKIFPEINEFFCEQVKVLITHIAGYPKKYAKGIKDKLRQSKPKVFISGHSHILKVMLDEELQILHINPGAAGKSGFHKIRTMIRFEVENADIKNMEVIELASQ